MPNLKSSTLVPLGLLSGVFLSSVLYFSQPYLIQTIVYTTYIGLINGLQLYELAWILGTIDYLLSFSFMYPLGLWLGFTVIIALLVRKMNASLIIIGTAILLLGGTWLLFTIKYAPEVGFTPGEFFAFILWKILIPLGITLGLAALISLPFSLLQRHQPTTIEAPNILSFVCSNCSAEYRSQPLICVKCGKEGTIEEHV